MASLALFFSSFPSCNNSQQLFISNFEFTVYKWQVWLKVDILRK